MEDINLAPIAIFTYNRPYHLKQTINFLAKNTYAKDSILYIFSDGPKNSRDLVLIEETREYISRINGFKKVILTISENNLGLSRNVTSGISHVLNFHDRVIVLEDDLITSTCFLEYMNTALELYKSDPQVCEIMGYSFVEKFVNVNTIESTFFLKGGDSLGWATWKRAWKFYEENAEKLIEEINTAGLVNCFNRGGAYDFFSMLKMQAEGKVDSWAIRWYASTFLKNLLTLYPTKSMVLHIGNDGNGTNYNNHTKINDPLNVILFKGQKYCFDKIEIIESRIGLEYYKLFLKSYNLGFFQRLFIKFKNIFYAK